MCCNLTRANDFFPGVITRHPSRLLTRTAACLARRRKTGAYSYGRRCCAAGDARGQRCCLRCWRLRELVRPSQPALRQFLPGSRALRQLSTLAPWRGVVPWGLLAFLARRHPLPFIRIPARQTRRTSHLMSTPDKHTRAWHCPLRSIPCASRGRGALCLLNWPR